MFKVENTNKYEQDFAFYTLVTCFDEYKEMVDSAKRAGFDREKINFFYFDNINSNDFDGYSGLNYALKNSNAKYIIFCHQDILFNYDNYEKLTKCIVELNYLDKNWAVAGNAGKNVKGDYFIKITDPKGEQHKGNLPAEVMSLDENFLIINNKNNLSCSILLKGFHLYGTDLCQNAIGLGLKCYVIDFHLYHKSSGKLDKSFYDSISSYIIMLTRRKKAQLVFTACTRFFVSNSSILNKLLNYRLFNKIYRMLCHLK